MVLPRTSLAFAGPSCIERERGLETANLQEISQTPKTSLDHGWSAKIACSLQHPKCEATFSYSLSLKRKTTTNTMYTWSTYMKCQKETSWWTTTQTDGQLSKAKHRVHWNSIYSVRTNWWAKKKCYFNVWNLRAHSHYDLGKLPGLLSTCLKDISIKHCQQDKDQLPDKLMNSI